MMCDRLHPPIGFAQRRLLPRAGRASRRPDALAHARAGVRRCRGVGLVELMVVIGILAVLLAILLPVLVKVRNSQRSVQCIGNLRKISSALHAYSLDNEGRLPDPGVADKSWEQMIQKYYPIPFQCPSDTELF